MKTNKPTLEQLLTGSDQVDVLIRAAYDLGAMEKANSVLEEQKQMAKINTTKKILAILVRKLRISPAEAVALLEIPRKEQKTYIKILNNQLRQKEASKAAAGSKS